MLISLLICGKSMVPERYEHTSRQLSIWFSTKSIGIQVINNQINEIIINFSTAETITTRNKYKRIIFV